MPTADPRPCSSSVVADRIRQVDGFNLWRLIEDQHEPDAPLHIERSAEPRTAECGKSLIGGLVEIQTVGKVKVCGPCARRRW